MSEETKVVEENSHRINDLTFCQFCSKLWSYDVVSRATGRVIPRYILFWNRMSIEKIKSKFNLVLRER